MTVEFDKGFSKSLDKIKNKKALEDTKKAIENCEQAQNISEIKGFTKMVGYKNYYRIKFNEYRIGIEIIDNVIWFIVLAHRSSIYKIFP